MANTRLLDLTGLTSYDAKIKARIKAKEEALSARISQNEGDIDTIESDYLKAADKNELKENIESLDSKVTTLIGEDANKSVRKIANEELTTQLIPESAKESLDTLQEIAAWIQSHPDDAAAMNKAIEALQSLIGSFPQETVATTIVEYIAELVGKEESRAKGIESGLEERIAPLEADTHTHTNKEILDSIDTNKVENWDNAKSYTDSEIAKVTPAAIGTYTKEEIDALTVLNMNTF